jgi:hypothetical protein
MMKKVGRGIYAFVAALAETFTLSFYKNIKKHYKGPSNEFKEVKIPENFVDSKLEPEFKELELGENPTIESKGFGNLWK